MAQSVFQTDSLGYGPNIESINADPSVVFQLLQFDKPHEYTFKITKSIEIAIDEYTT